MVAACIAALDVIADEPDRLARLWSNTELFKSGLHELGFDTGASETPITPVITGDEARTQAFARAPVRRGCLLPRDRVPDGGQGSRARARRSSPPTTPSDDLREALDVFGRVGSELGLR